MNKNFSDKNFSEKKAGDFESRLNDSEEKNQSG
jgi:hypothetical protein